VSNNNTVSISSFINSICIIITTTIFKECSTYDRCTLHNKCLKQQQSYTTINLFKLPIIVFYVFFKTNEKISKILKKSQAAFVRGEAVSSYLNFKHMINFK